MNQIIDGTADHENEFVRGRLHNLNSYNGADLPLLKLAKQLLDEFPENLYGVEQGIAYGGGVERIGHLWKGRGTIYGMDTFEGHPSHLALDPDSAEAKCMEHWYSPTIYGKEAYQYDYIRKSLDEDKLDNVILVKGEVNEHSCDDIPKLHYALLDMDIIQSMINGYSGIKGKIVKGGYLALHDVLPETHLGGHIYNWWYKDTMKQDGYEVYEEYPQSHLGIYRKL